MSDNVSVTITQKSNYQFEAFCTVTQSVRHGIPVAISVEDGMGVRVNSPST